MAEKQLRKESEHENIVPFRPFNMFSDMERMFEQMVPQGWMQPTHWRSAWFGEGQPQLDVIDRDDDILVRAAIPGVNKEDLDVSLTDHTVTVRGNTRQESKQEEEGEYYRHEIVSGNFLRTVTLPASVDESKAKAVFRDGILELTLPKMESAKRHTVKVE